MWNKFEELSDSKIEELVSYFLEGTPSKRCFSEFIKITDDYSASAESVLKCAQLLKKEGYHFDKDFKYIYLKPNISKFKIPKESKLLWWFEKPNQLSEEEKKEFIEYVVNLSHEHNAFANFINQLYFYEPSIECALELIEQLEAYHIYLSENFYNSLYFGTNITTSMKLFYEDKIRGLEMDLEIACPEFDRLNEHEDEESDDNYMKQTETKKAPLNKTSTTKQNKKGFFASLFSNKSDLRKENLENLDYEVYDLEEDYNQAYDEYDEEDVDEIE